MTPISADSERSIPLQPRERIGRWNRECLMNRPTALSTRISGMTAGSGDWGRSMPLQTAE
ncbi:MAG TPA: hypothetical protein VF625_08210 [Longimicrobium sp.]